MKSIVALVSIAAMAPIAAAQLFVGVDDPGFATELGDITDLADVTYTPEFSGIAVWGATFDAVGRQLWISDGADLYRSPVAGPPTFVASMSFGGAGASMVGLGWAHGQLYGFRSVGTPGIYRINTTTGVADLLLGTPNHDFGGFDFNAADGLFYGANDATTGGGRGLYSIDLFGAGAITKIASYPSSQTDVDGLAVGGGKAWLTTDETGNFFAYDLAQGQNGSYVSFKSPWTSAKTFAGAAYIPEPAAFVMASIGALLAARRRRGTR